MECKEVISILVLSFSGDDAFLIADRAKHSTSSTSADRGAVFDTTNSLLLSVSPLCVGGGGVATNTILNMGVRIYNIFFGS